MEHLLRTLSLLVLLTPLAGGVIAGLAGKKIGRAGAHWVTIVGVAISFVCSLFLFKLIVLDSTAAHSLVIYTWGESGSFRFDVSFLLDHLTAVMMITVTFVSLLVHIYSIGYMKDDSGYQRFFSYMSLFTFFMLSLVLANDFLLLFFGWEGVGLVSYLLIGFWFNKESAAQGSLKAFLANRVGDFGFILGIAAILDYFGSINYATVFQNAPAIAHSMITILPGVHWPVMTVICLLLFIGAMGKSAQVPLHVWLPESMEGPTPISALIHAATMVTAGVYMVARMSPLFELSSTALSTMMIIGSVGALFMGLLGVVQNDIKRVIAYSTISQLGYMMAANGASAFSAGIFHLMTHACFKALLFLAAGSVIIAMHHEQDLRKMGNLKKYMPITYVCFLIGGLALSAIPPFAGFYSKDAIIEAVGLSKLTGATFSYWCLVFGAFVTGLYTFRAFFLAFHGKERQPEATKSHLKESPWVVTIPLILLAIPSAILGAMLAGPMLYAHKDLLGAAIYIAPKFDVMGELAAHYHGWFIAFISSVTTLPFWFAAAGVTTAWVCYIKYPHLPEQFAKRMKFIYFVLIEKYGFDNFNELVFVRGTQRLSTFLFRVADLKFIDDIFVNGSGRGTQKISGWLRRLQTGYLYHYAFAMILGLVAFLCWLLL